MLTENPLDLVQAAYLCGGPRRAVLVTLLTLIQDKTIAVSSARHRVRYVSGLPNNQLEQVVVDSVPEGGLQLAELVDRVVVDQAMRDLRASLVERGLLRRWRFAGRTLRGRQAHRQLRDDGRSGLARVAAVGPEAITDTRLRDIFTTPDPAQAAESSRVDQTGKLWATP
ncbi:uncharacterized protein (TIGR04222 family) [Kribbella sp. VKM Ac-2527]|uniref:Uncharacterized protein (TIGR04222 family) n=1 Tax=Kribbella caucasensis TaxID=2512215 RepID=A0A4R6KQI9_9ACTN|nr:TIGR04222 domain-containing membrane protein [Kribbella sp. VKM Ac-2527]TDO54975.1 uncharacterized protein (TIGR04222 family) [Kribbella sp. VKM Ac-2527]